MSIRVEVFVSMYLSHVLFSLLCVSTALTSAIKQGVKSEHEIDRANNSSFTPAGDVVKDQLPNHSEVSSGKIFPPEKIKKLNASKMSEPILEGGGKAEPSFALLPSAPMISTEASSSITSSTTGEGIQREREAKVSARKEVTEQVRINIKARKGVGNESSSTETDSSLENAKLKYALNISTAQPSVSKQINKEVSTLEPKSQSSTERKNVSSVTEVPQKVVTVKVKKHKLKPTVTIGGSNVDEPIPASPTKSPPLGMPRKIDYIIPVMITILALPMLGVTSYVMYRRGRDCWDKRHYRRMDFLIDGMYNE